MGQPGVEPLAGLAEAEPYWRELGERSGNLFATWEWAGCWLRYAAGKGRPRPVLCRGENGDPVALLPLIETSDHGLRVLRLAGHREADQLGLVSPPAERHRAEAALGRLLAEDDGWDAFLAEHVPSDTGPELGPVLWRTASPVVDLDAPDYDSFLEARSRNFRSEARRRARRLERAFRVSFRRSEDPACLDRDLDALFRLHEARWGGPSRSFSPERRALHREFAHAALARGWLSLRLLELDGRPVSALLSFRFGGAEWFYQAGRDPAYDRWSVGLLLHLHAIRCAIEDGLREYRLLRGAEAYKSRLANRDPGLTTVGRARTAGGRAWLGSLGPKGPGSVAG